MGHKHRTIRQNIIAIINPFTRYIPRILVTATVIAELNIATMISRKISSLFLSQNDFCPDFLYGFTIFSWPKKRGRIAIITAHKISPHSNSKSSNGPFTKNGGTMQITKRKAKILYTVKCRTIGRAFSFSTWHIFSNAPLAATESSAQ